MIGAEVVVGAVLMPEKYLVVQDDRIGVGSRPYTTNCICEEEIRKGRERERERGGREERGEGEEGGERGGKGKQ